MAKMQREANDATEAANEIAPPEQKMWQAVIYNAVVEATNENAKGEALLWKNEADTWLRRGSDLHVVCALAGMDSEFVRDAYISGRIDRLLLKSANGVEA